MASTARLSFLTSLPFSLLLVLYFVLTTSAEPIEVTFDDCFSGSASDKLNITNVYAQILTTEALGRHLNFTVIGEAGEQIVGTETGSGHLTTLFTSSEILTFSVWNFASYLCNSIRPPSPLPSLDNTSSNYCPVSPGSFAFSSFVPLDSSHELTTLQTRLRAVNPATNDIFCIDLQTTPLRPGVTGSVYGHARIILWSTVALAIAYWILVGMARISSAWSRRSGWSGRGFLPSMENVGFVLASAISGEGLAKSPALIRFSTPSMRDIFFHSQWCAALSMVAVQWPAFAYPLLTQTAWSTLSFNITFSQGKDGDQEHWNPLFTPAFNPPSNFSDQISDETSPLFLDVSVPNTLFTLPTNASSGLASFAYTIGVRPQDLFGICMSLFLCIVGGTIAVSLLIWAVDSVATSLDKAIGGRRQGPNLSTRRYSTGSKDMLEATAPSGADEERSHNSHFLLRSTNRFPASTRKHWVKLRPDFSSFHFSVLNGNLIRILMLFHLPITIFSSYQLSLGHTQVSTVSIALAAVSLAVFSIVTPCVLILRLFMTPTNKLFDETWTLLSLGPLYNLYRHGSQLFACLFFAISLAFGITIGCGQKSGTAQAIIILVIEVVSSLVTSIWLPWGHGASMGLISFLFCVARIVIAVLLVILTPTVSIGTEAGQWVAYAILFILALIYLSFALMLFFKIIEALVRIFGGVGFDRSRHAVDAGLLGACGLVGCCGDRKRRTRKHRYKGSDAPSNGSYTLSRAAAAKNPAPSSSGPPSVLRPEHALRPYKEESDDENGYIMGAWQPFPRTGYNVVESPASTPPATKTGFSRVGGGRAHYESPYAIASGSTFAFPSADPSTKTNTSSQRISNDSFNGPAGRSAVLPQGALPPHVRKKSQSAVIEDMAALAAARSNAANAQSPHIPAARRQSLHPEIGLVSNDKDDGDDYAEAPKKKHWFNIRKPRRHSEGDDDRAKDTPVFDDDGPEEDKGRSFTVVRTRRASQPLATMSGARGSGGDAGPSSEGSKPGRSFVVVRGNNNPPS